MKRWIFFTATLIFSLGIQNSANAWIGQVDSEIETIKGQKSGYMVLSRMDLSIGQFHLVFYGASSRTPEQVIVKIHNRVTGAQVFAELVHTQGGGQVETFDISDLQAGSYDLSVESNNYKLEESFLLQKKQ